MKLLKAVVFSVSILLLCRPAHAEPKKVFVVTSYAYDFKSHPNAPQIAQSLCGTRCNALSVDQESYMSPGGWRMVKVKSGQKKVIDISNPFISGKCICVGDDYLVDKEYPEGGFQPLGEIRDNAKKP